MQFWGYKRKEGRAGIRNHVLILPTCACGSESCRVVASQVRGAVNIVFNTCLLYTSLQGFGAVPKFSVSRVFSQIVPYFLIFVPAKLVNTLVK